jgi:hypothetical protein
MIIGAHAIIYSRDPEADRDFLRDVLRLSHVDAGEGWLIFALPPSELAVHPSKRNGVHEVYLLCSDVRRFVARMRRRRVRCGPIRSQVWGRLTEVSLPGGGRLGVYEPRHPRPRPALARSAGRSRPSRPPRDRMTPE